MNTTTKNLQSGSEEGTCLSGSTLILDSEGQVHLLEDLASEVDTNITVPAIDSQGRVVSASAYDFRIGEWARKIYKITLSNGHTVEATANHPFLSASGEWITAEKLVFGHLLRTATYDPKCRNPQLSLNEVSSVIVKYLQEPIPMYDFTVKKHSNLFVAQEIDSVYSLICVHNSQNM